MSFEITEEKLALFQSLFKGREDAFAVRWEKDGKSGYMPSYQVDWDAYKVHKMKGGTFQRFESKILLPPTPKEYVKHLAGEQVIGIYPLLDDNTSWFVAVDFDKQGWEDECRKFLTLCDQYKIPASLERSQSGNGGHVWHISKTKEALHLAIRMVEDILQEIRNTGKQDYLKKEHSNFSRIFHEYSDPKKGFVLWKGQLEERIT